MSSSAISSYTNNISQLVQPVRLSRSGSAGSSSSTSSTSSGYATSNDSSSLSPIGQLFKELEALSKSDPTEFKKATAQIAEQLQSAANNSTDPGQANLLDQMAANFTKASQSGNFSDLFPSKSQDAVSELNSAAATSQAPPPYGRQSSGSGAGGGIDSGDDTLSAIFAQALSQIKSDLSSRSTSTS
jgi:hypothetical protein